MLNMSSEFITVVLYGLLQVTRLWWIFLRQVRSVINLPSSTQQMFHLPFRIDKPKQLLAFILLKGNWEISYAMYRKWPACF